MLACLLVGMQEDVELVVAGTDVPGAVERRSSAALGGILVRGQARHDEEAIAH